MVAPLVAFVVVGWITYAEMGAAGSAAIEWNTKGGPCSFDGPLKLPIFVYPDANSDSIAANTVTLAAQPGADQPEVALHPEMAAGANVDAGVSVVTFAGEKELKEHDAERLAQPQEWLKRRWRARMPAAEAARLLAIHPKSALKWYGRFAQEELQEELKPV